MFDKVAGELTGRWDEADGRDGSEGAAGSAQAAAGSGGGVAAGPAANLATQKPVKVAKNLADRG